MKLSADSSAKINLIARHYLDAPEDKLSPPVQAEFQNLVNYLYTQVKKSQIKDVRVSGQPYASATELLADFQQNRRIQVSTDYNDPIVLHKEGNLQFRFIHDYHHCVLNADFSWEGEIKAYRYFCSLTHNETFHRILRSELIYQAAVCVYLGYFPDTQKLVLSDPF